MKTHTLGAGQFVEFILTREWSEAMKMTRTAEILNEAERRSGNLQFKQLPINLKKKNQNSTGAITTFCVVYCEAVVRGLDNV